MVIGTSSLSATPANAVDSNTFYFCLYKVVTPSGTTFPTEYGISVFSSGGNTYGAQFIAGGSAGCPDGQLLGVITKGNVDGGTDIPNMDGIGGEMTCMPNDSLVSGPVDYAGDEVPGFTINADHGDSSGPAQWFSYYAQEFGASPVINTSNTTYTATTSSSDGTAGFPAELGFVIQVDLDITGVDGFPDIYCPNIIIGQQRTSSKFAPNWSTLAEKTVVSLVGTAGTFLVDPVAGVSEVGNILVKIIGSLVADLLSEDETNTFWLSVGENGSFPGPPTAFLTPPRTSTYNFPQNGLMVPCAGAGGDLDGTYWLQLAPGGGEGSQGTTFNLYQYNKTTD